LHNLRKNFAFLSRWFLFQIKDESKWIKVTLVKSPLLKLEIHQMHSFLLNLNSYFLTSKIVHSRFVWLRLPGFVYGAILISYFFKIFLFIFMKISLCFCICIRCTDFDQIKLIDSAKIWENRINKRRNIFICIKL